MNFDVYGPYEIARFTPKKLITKESCTDLQSRLSEFDTSCGCYIFAMRAGKGIKPWYVGQANKSSLIQEALNPSNIVKFNTDVLSRFKGTPVIFFLPLLTGNKKVFAKPTKRKEGRKSVDFLEEWLIASALQKNPSLINKQKTKFLRDIHVRGIFNPVQGEADDHSAALKKTLNLS